MRCSVILFYLLGAGFGSVSLADDLVAELFPDRPVVSAADYFFYVCVDEYMKANSIRQFDGSEGYALEYSNEPAEVLIALHDAASEFAATIRAPDYSDPEHGLPAVLALCKNESITEHVDAIASEARASAH